MQPKRCGIWRSAPVDVLFTDINLPGGMDGVVLARRARELLPELPVVYASGRVNMLDAAAVRTGLDFCREALCAGLGRTASHRCVEGHRGAEREWLLLDGAAREELLEPVDVIIPVDDVRLPRQSAEQWQRGLDAVDDKFVERAL